MTQQSIAPDITTEDVDRRIATGLRLIRDAPGTVYSRDLYDVLGLTSANDHASPELDAEVITRLNCWFETPLVIADGTSSRSIPGMVELVSVIDFRTFLDLLLVIIGGEDPAEVQIHPGEVLKVTSVDDDHVDVRLGYPALGVPRPAHQCYQGWVDAVQEHYDARTRSATRRLLHITQEKLAYRVTHDHGIAVVDLNDCYLEDIDLPSTLDALADGEHAPRVRLLARRAVFTGSRINLGRTEYSAFNVSWSVFTARVVTLLGATFNFDSTLDDSDPTSTVQFRDSTFCPEVLHLSFNEVVVAGTTRAISFEDAQTWGTRITFDRCDLGRTALDFYQTRLLAGSTVEFVETKMGDATLRFVDATLSGTADTPGVVVFYRVSPLPPSDFLFRSADEVRIENCSLGPYARFANIAKLSLWRSSVSAALLSVMPRDDVLGDFGENKFWLLDALEVGRSTERAALAAEFAAVKEVFRAMGEYDLEDEAFVRHMRFKTSTPLGRFAYRVLDRVGRFGTSPKRMVFSMLGAFLGFSVLDCVLMKAFPSQFNAAPQHLVIDGLTAAASRLLQASSPIAPTTSAMTLVFLIQSLTGWFFLGYLFAGFMRKTLR